MLTQELLLSSTWLTLGTIVTLLRGTYVRRGGPLRSLLWLIVLLFSGDIIALLTFGDLQTVAIQTLITFLIGCWAIWRLPNWNALGQTVMVMSITTGVLYMAYSFAVTAFTPLHPLTFVLALSLTFAEWAALLLGLSYVYESLDVCCRIRWKRRFGPMTPIPGYLPKVSLHVPAYSEPPEVVEATLRSIAKLNYPNYEVLLIDNNTPTEAIWRPLEKICHELGPRFRFLHLDEWPGYKSGALNFALTQTAPDTEIIGIIDADYLVSPDFLHDMTPYFADPHIAFVQTPQDYRDYQGNPFLIACLHAYQYFFAVSMPSRNEHNAIIFAGTMGLIRRSVLQEIGGWDEWCITEDAEASLRVLERGYQSIYVNRAYGTGLMPFTFDGLKKQRFRWCFGGIQILKKHWESLLPWSHRVDPANHLTQAQRYYYLLGGLQWFNEPLNLCFTFFLILGALVHLSPLGGLIRPLTGPLIVLPAVFLIIGMWRFLWVLRYALRLSFVNALKAMGNFFSLGWTVALACFQGLIQPGGVFMRTPKSQSSLGLVRAIRTTQWETLIGLTCLAFGVAVNTLHPQVTTLFLGAFLVWQAALYLSAPYYSLLSIRSQAPKLRAHQAEMRGPQVQETWLVRVAAIFALIMIVVVGIALLLPPPPQTPSYANFQPPTLSINLFPILPSSTPFEVATDTPTSIVTETVTGTPSDTPATGSAIPTSTQSIIPPSSTPTLAMSVTVTSLTPSYTLPPPSATATSILPTLPVTNTFVPPSPTPPPPTIPPPTATLVPPSPTLPPPTVPPPTATRAPPSPTAALPAINTARNT